MVCQMQTPRRSSRVTTKTQNQCIRLHSQCALFVVCCPANKHLKTRGVTSKATDDGYIYDNPSSSKTLHDPRGSWLCSPLSHPTQHHTHASVHRTAIDFMNAELTACHSVQLMTLVLPDDHWTLPRPGLATSKENRPAEIVAFYEDVIDET